MTHKLTRRDLLASGLGAAGLLMTGGLPLFAAAEKQKTKAKPVYYPKSVRPQDAPSVPVAIERCRTYDPVTVRQKIDAAMRLIGGLKRLVSNKTVTIKINATGGPGFLADLPAYRTYHIHPNVLAALCGALYDANARRIVILESQYSTKRPEEVYGEANWDIAAIKSAGGHRVTFEDTRNRGRWPQYSRLTVPWGGFLFPAFDVNPSYEKTDVLVSLAKLKDHLAAGITGAVKNLFGMTPTSLYGHDSPNEASLSYRGPVLHNGQKAVPDGVPKEIKEHVPLDWKYRVPRVTADCLGARPIHLSVIDGIETNRAGEGPWAPNAEPIRPGLLLVGRNPVCTDAVCAGVMGYDPQARHFEFPFPGENHLLLLASVGLGQIDLKKIEVRGLPLEKAVHPFNPKRLPLDIPTAYHRHYNAGWQEA